MQPVRVRCPVPLDRRLRGAVSLMIVVVFVLEYGYGLKALSEGKRGFF